MSRELDVCGTVAGFYTRWCGASSVLPRGIISSRVELGAAVFRAVTPGEEGAGPLGTPGAAEDDEGLGTRVGGATARGGMDVGAS